MSHQSNVIQLNLQCTLLVNGSLTYSVLFYLNIALSLFISCRFGTNIVSSTSILYSTRCFQNASRMKFFIIYNYKDHINNDVGCLQRGEEGVCLLIYLIFYFMDHKVDVRAVIYTKRGKRRFA